MESNMAIFKIMMMYAIVSISAAAYDPLSKTNSEKLPFWTRRSIEEALDQLPMSMLRSLVAKKEVEENLPMSFISKKRSEEKSKIPMSLMSRKSTDEEMPMSLMNLKKSNIPVRFMLNKKETENICRRAIEVCSNSMDKRDAREKLIDDIKAAMKKDA